MTFFMINKIIERMKLGFNKTLIIPLGAGGIVFIFWLIISIPLNQLKHSLKAELMGLEDQIQQIEAMGDQDKTKEEKVRILREKYQLLGNKFPEKEEESLGLLSSYAQELQIEVISIKSQPKKVFLDVNHKKVEAGGKSCQEIPVTIEMKGTYQASVQYIEMLREVLPAYVVVEKIKMHKDPLEPSRLDVHLDLNLYLLS